MNFSINYSKQGFRKVILAKETKKALKQISVTDRAIGLTSEDAEKCFLTVGNYTSHETSRGFFSRGAKDVSNIGHVTFETIKDGLYSKVEIKLSHKLSELNERYRSDVL